MAAKKKTELAVKADETTALVADYEYGEMAGDGFDNVTQEDVSIPFLTCVQAMSPQVQETEAEFIEGAKAGMLMNTVTKEMFDGKDGVEFVPCLTQHLYVEWKNRQTDGGGFIGVHQCDSDVVRQARQDSTAFGKYSIPIDGGIDHDLVETFYIFGLLIKGDEIITPCMISFSSTKIKAYKSIMSPLRQVKNRPPLYAFKLRITTVAEKNPKGTFHNFKIVPANGDAVSSLIAPEHEFVQAGKALKDSVQTGDAKVDHGGSVSGDSSGSEKPAPF